MEHKITSATTETEPWYTSNELGASVLRKLFPKRQRCKTIVYVYGWMFINSPILHESGWPMPTVVYNQTCKICRPSIRGALPRRLKIEHERDLMICCLKINPARTQLGMSLLFFERRRHQSPRGGERWSGGGATRFRRRATLRIFRPELHQYWFSAVFIRCSMTVSQRVSIFIWFALFSMSGAPSVLMFIIFHRFQKYWFLFSIVKEIQR